MRMIFKLFLVFVCMSCSLFESKEAKTQKLVEQELYHINWSDVDDYPLFNECDETVSKKLQRVCFENRLLAFLSADLQNFQLVSDTKIKDVVFLDFKINNEGEITVLKIENTTVLGDQKTAFEATITNSLNNLPHIEPALKRGIPVSAKFRIPIFLNSK